MHEKLEITIITPDGRSHTCFAPEVGASPDPSIESLSDEEKLGLGMTHNHLSKPQPMMFSLKSGGVLVLGPLTAARSQYIIAPIKEGPIYPNLEEIK